VGPGIPLAPPLLFTMARVLAWPPVERNHGNISGMENSKISDSPVNEGKAGCLTTVSKSVGSGFESRGVYNAVGPVLRQ
jgi:hypothetical protein